MQINEAESIQSSESSPQTVVDKEIQDSSIIEDITQTTSDEITKENSTESESNEKQPEILSKEVIETVSEATLDETPTAQIWTALPRMRQVQGMRIQLKRGSQR